MKHFSLLLIFLVTGIFSFTQTWQDTVAGIEAIFTRYKASNPGCQLAISRNGQVIFSKAWGMADLEHNTSLTTESIIEAGSVSKQFTAACILLLEQQGKLSLDDDVRKYLLEIPDYGTVITLRQMMHHTSGFRDWGSVMAIAGWPRSTKTYNNDDALYIVTRQKALNNKPGDEFLYSNSNYNLFAVIIERVSGISLAEYSRKYIFEPAGMKHTQWRDNFKRIVPNRAMAYSKVTGGYETNMPNEYVYGNGGLLTTAEDLLIWNNYYLNGKFGSPSLLSKQLRTDPLNNGNMNEYAAGLFIDRYKGWNTISHGGATASYRASLSCYPDVGLSIAWLSNTSEFDNANVNAAAAVADLFIKDTATNAKKDSAITIAIAPEKLNSYKGWYKNNRGGAFNLYVKDGKLYSSSHGPLTPIAENIFTADDNRIELLNSPQRALRFYTTTKDTIFFSGVDSAHLTPETMNEYVGEYYSDEAEVRSSIIIKNNSLFIHRDPKSDTPVIPTFKDGFDFSGGTLFFERDKSNKIIKMYVTVSRARNVVFEKVK